MKEIEGQDIGATTVRRRWTAASALAHVGPHTIRLAIDSAKRP